MGWWIVLVILIIFLASGVGYYFYATMMTDADRTFLNGAWKDDADATNITKFAIDITNLGTMSTPGIIVATNISVGKSIFGKYIITPSTTTSDSFVLVVTKVSDIKLTLESDKKPGVIYTLTKKV
jgi:hypothetical protein